MTDIIDFLQYRNDKQEQTIEQCFKKAHSLDEKLDRLIQNQELQVNDHRLFLAFLGYLEEQELSAKQTFQDVIQLPKHQFEKQYQMNWAQVVKLSVTFLSILRTNDPQSYRQFND